MTESKRPIALTIAVILVWLEAAASLIYGALQALNLVFNGAKDVGGTISVIFFFLLVAAWLTFLKSRLLLPKPEQPKAEEPPAEELSDVLAGSRPRRRVRSGNR